MVRKKFTTTLNETIIQQLKIQAIKEGTDASKIIEKLVEEYRQKAILGLRQPPFISHLLYWATPFTFLEVGVFCREMINEENDELIMTRDMFKDKRRT